MSELSVLQSRKMKETKWTYDAVVARYCNVMPQCIFVTDHATMPEPSCRCIQSLADKIGCLKQSRLLNCVM